MDTRQQQIDAAKALVRASYTDGRYTGEETLTPHVLTLAAKLRSLEPAGAIDQAQAAELLGSGAPVLQLRTQVIECSAAPGPEAA